jgi:fibronectin-binding autotransporter adhesin
MRFHTPSLLSLLLVAGAGSLSAQSTVTWSATPGNGNWSPGTNWNGGVAPVNTDRVVFGASSTTALTNDIAGLQLNTVANASPNSSHSAIRFLSTAGSYTIGGALALHNTNTAGGTSLITNESTATQTFSGPLIFTTVSGQSAAIATAGNLNFDGTITVNSSADLSTSMVTGASARTINYNGAITLSSASTKGIGFGSGFNAALSVYNLNATVTKNDSAGATTFSGGLSSGTLNVNADVNLLNDSTKTFSILHSGGTSPSRATMNINHASAFDDLTSINILVQGNSTGGTANGTASLLIGANTWTSSVAISIGTNANSNTRVVLGGKTGLGAAGVATFNGNITAQDTTNDLNRTLELTAAEGQVNFNGVIGTAAGGTSVITIEKTGAGTVALGGDNTYVGNTTVTAGTLLLTSTGEMRFRIQDGNVSNSILGSGTVDLDGVLRLDITGLTNATGTWTLVDTSTLTESYGDNFGLAFVGGPSFTNNNDGTYTSGNYTFTESTGQLVLVPEPSASLLLIGSLTSLVVFRRRRS